jgi:hypothetical protein
LILPSVEVVVVLLVRLLTTAPIPVTKTHLPQMLALLAAAKAVFLETTEKRLKQTVVAVAVVARDLHGITVLLVELAAALVVLVT